jgi:hypothetical protein
VNSPAHEGVAAETWKWPKLLTQSQRLGSLTSACQSSDAQAKSRSVPWPHVSFGVNGDMVGRQKYVR